MRRASARGFRGKWQGGRLAMGNEVPFLWDFTGMAKAIPHQEKT